MYLSSRLVLVAFLRRAGAAAKSEHAESKWAAFKAGAAERERAAKEKGDFYLNGRLFSSRLFDAGAGAAATSERAEFKRAEFKSWAA